MTSGRMVSIGFNGSYIGKEPGGEWVQEVLNKYHDRMLAPEGVRVELHFIALPFNPHRHPVDGKCTECGKEVKE